MCNLSINNISNYGLSFLQENLWESVKQTLSKRVVIVALVALSCLSAFYFVYRCCCWRASWGGYDVRNWGRTKDPADSWVSPVTKHRHQTPVQVDVEDLEPDEVNVNSLEEEKRLIRSLKQKWLDDPQKERQRLIDAKILSASAQQAIQSIYGPGTYLPNSHKEEASMVMGRVLELKRFYYKTHYVFTHGQSLEVSVANQLIKYFVRAFTPRLDHPLKIPFRVPHSVTYSENADDFIQKYHATEENLNFQDNQHNAEMVSVDAQFWNKDQCESALNFFSTGTNILSGGLLKIFQSIFSHYVPNATVSNMLANKASGIAVQIRGESKVGALYAICIPKSIVQDEKINFAYRCHPFGKRCDCYPVADRIPLLEEMQRNKPVFCKEGRRAQYRLLASRLTEEKDVRSFAVDALAKGKRKYYRDQIKALVKEATQYSHLCALLENFDDDPAVMDQIHSLIEDSPQLDRQCIQQLFAAKGLSYQ